jgi:hypothetical protein
VEDRSVTAIAVVRSDAEGIFIVSDGAGVDPNGVVRQFMQKVIPLPMLTAAIAVRGPFEIMAYVQVALYERAPNNFEELLKCLPEIARDARTRFPRLPSEYMVGGLSWERQRFETYSLYTADMGGLKAVGADGQMFIPKPFELNGTPATFGAPSPSPELAAEFGVGDDFKGQFSPYVQGPAMIQAMRRMPNDKGHFNIGGFVMLTTVSVRGVNMEILHRWPDRIGEKIVPAG